MHARGFNSNNLQLTNWRGGWGGRCSEAAHVTLVVVGFDNTVVAAHYVALGRQEGRTAVVSIVLTLQSECCQFSEWVCTAYACRQVTCLQPLADTAATVAHSWCSGLCWGLGLQQVGSGLSPSAHICVVLFWKEEGWQLLLL